MVFAGEGSNLKATHKNTQLDYSRAKKLRHESTPYEQKLWRILQPASKKSGLKFRRQHPLHPYIADFVCLEARLIVELDGLSHDTRQDYDAIRSARLKQQGYETLRFPNHEVAKNPEAIVEIILITTSKLLKQKTLTDPSPARGEN